MKSRLLIAVIAGGMLMGGIALPLIAAPGRTAARERVSSADAERGWRAEAQPRDDGDYGDDSGERRGGRGEFGRGPGFGPPPPPRGPGGPGGFGGPGMPPPDSPEMAARTLLPFWENETIAAKLSLTPEQVKSLQDSLDLTLEALEGSGDGPHDSMKALEEEMKKDSPDLDTVYKLLDTASAARSEKAKIVIGHAVTVKTVLTEEQEATLKKAGPAAAREIGERMHAIGDEIHDIMREGGTIEEVKARLEEKDIPEHLRERILERVQHRLEMGEDEEGFMPPPPPDADGPRRGPRGPRGAER